MDIDVIWKYIFFLLSLWEAGMLKVFLMLKPSSLEGSSSYVLWAPDRKWESRSKAKLIQTKWNDAVEVSGMEGPRGREVVSHLLPLSSPALCGAGEVLFEEDGCCGNQELPKAEWVFHFWGTKHPGRKSLCNAPPNCCPWLSRAPGNGWKAWHAYTEGTDVAPPTLAPSGLAPDMQS